MGDSLADPCRPDPKPNPLPFLPDEFEDMGIILFECGIRCRQTPKCNSDDVDGDFSGDTHQRVSLLDDLPVRAENSVREEISVEHPDRAGKLGRQTIIDGLIKSGEAFRFAWQCLTSLLEIAEEFVVSADVSRREYHGIRSDWLIFGVPSRHSRWQFLQRFVGIFGHAHLVILSTPI
jgi:hypothetical protein